MEIGGTGVDGVPVASHVEQEQDLALEAVAVLHLRVVEQVALDQAHTHKTVTHNVAQLMAIGATGADGVPAASHVEQEQDLALGAVAVLHLHVVEQVALDQAHTRKTVTHNVAELMAIGDTGADGLLAARHVAQEQDPAIEAATIHPLPVVDIVALDTTQSQNTVTHNVAELMAIGGPGVHGLLVTSGQKKDIAKDTATILTLHVADTVVQDTTNNINAVTLGNHGHLGDHGDLLLTKVCLPAASHVAQ